MAYVNYSSPALDTGYLSSGERLPTGLDASAFFLTEGFLGSVLADDILPESILQTFDLDDLSVFTQAVVDNWDVIFRYNWRMCVCVVFGLMMSLLVPLAGIVWCSRRCCCSKCKSNSFSRFDARKNSDDSRDDREGDGGRGWGSSLKKQVCLTFFLVLWSFSMWGLIWHFSASHVMSQGLKPLATHADYIVKDSLRYITNTHKQVEHWGRTNMLELDRGFNAALEEASDAMLVAYLELENSDDMRLDEVENTTRIAERAVREFETDKAVIMESVIIFDGEAANMNTALGSFKAISAWNEILTNGQVCSVLACSEILAFLSDDLVLNTEDVPVPATIEDISFTTEEVAAMTTFNTDVLTMRQDTSNTVANFMFDNTNIVGSLLGAFQDIFNPGFDFLLEAMENLIFEDPDFGQDVQEVVDDWYALLYYGLMIPGYILTTILFLYAVGFILGLASMAGQGGGALGSSSGRLVFAGSVVFLSFSLLLWLYTTLFFVSGAAVQALGCETLEDPENSDLYTMFERDIDEEIAEALNSTSFVLNGTVEWSIPEMLEQCADDQSLYNILHLDQIFDVEKLTDWRNMSGGVVDNVQDLLDQAMGVMLQEVSDILTGAYPDAAMMEQLTAVMETFALLDDEYIGKLERGELDDFLELASLNQLSVYVNQMYAEADKVPELSGAVASLNASYVDFLGSVGVFNASINDAVGVCIAYRETILHTSRLINDELEDALEYMLEAATFILEDTTIGTELDVIVEDIARMVDGFVQYSVELVSSEIGRCLPFHDHVYQASINYACHQTVDPLNSVWSGIGLVLVCFVPLLLVAAGAENIFSARRRKRVADRSENNYSNSARVIFASETGNNSASHTRNNFANHAENTIATKQDSNFAAGAKDILASGAESVLAASIENALATGAENISATVAENVSSVIAENVSAAVAENISAGVTEKIFASTENAFAAGAKNVFAGAKNIFGNKKKDADKKELF